MPFSWDSFLLKCLCGLCQKGYTIHVWIQCSLGSKYLVLIEPNRSEHPMDYKSVPEHYPPSGENQRFTWLIWEGESWISASLSNTTKSCDQKIITIILSDNEQNAVSASKSTNKNKHDTLWIILKALFRCEIDHSSNIHRQIMPQSARSVAFWAVLTRNFPGSYILCTYINTQISICTYVWNTYIDM